MYDELQFKLSQNLEKIKDQAIRESINSSFQSAKALAAAATADSHEQVQASAAMNQAVVQSEQMITVQASRWSWFTMILVCATTAFLFFAIIAFFWRLTPQESISVAAVRPILVLSLIFSMLAFGGLLISRPLFMAGTAQEIGDRVKHSREIFMLFAGVFATIIGFYFGSTADSGAAAKDEIKTSQNVDSASGRLSVIVVDPDNSYKLLLTSADGKTTAPFAEDEKKKGLFTLALNGELPCPADMALALIDKSGVTVSKPVTLARSELAAAKWSKCSAPAASPAAGNTPS